MYDNSIKSSSISSISPTTAMRFVLRQSPQKVQPNSYRERYNNLNDSHLHHHNISNQDDLQSSFLSSEYDDSNIISGRSSLPSSTTTQQYIPTSPSTSMLNSTVDVDYDPIPSHSINSSHHSGNSSNLQHMSHAISLRPNLSSSSTSGSTRRFSSPSVHFNQEETEEQQQQQNQSFRNSTINNSAVDIENDSIDQFEERTNKLMHFIDEYTLFDNNQSLIRDTGNIPNNTTEGRNSTTSTTSTTSQPTTLGSPTTVYRYHSNNNSYSENYNFNRNSTYPNAAALGETMNNTTENNQTTNNNNGIANSVNSSADKEDTVSDAKVQKDKYIQLVKDIIEEFKKQGKDTKWTLELDHITKVLYAAEYKSPIWELEYNRIQEIVVGVRKGWGVQTKNKYSTIETTKQIQLQTNLVLLKQYIEKDLDELYKKLSLQQKNENLENQIQSKKLQLLLLGESINLLQ